LPAGISHLYARRAREVQASAIREICKLIAKPEVRSLAGGWPDPATFPVEEIRDISRQVLEENPDLALQYTNSEGLPELRSFLADWVKKTDGIDCTPDELFITHGSAQGMELAAKILIEPGDVALVGLPTYFGGSGACRTFGAELCGVALDSDGMIPEALAEEVGKIQAAGKRAKLVYVVPDFQNPSGATMPAGRREQLVKIAEEHDLVIVEDNPYRDLRYSGACGWLSAWPTRTPSGAWSSPVSSKTAAPTPSGSMCSTNSASEACWISRSRRTATITGRSGTYCCEPLRSIFPKRCAGTGRMGDSSCSPICRRGWTARSC
jgi:aspartate/methionine/tyrosine aminotransferase